MLQYEELVPWKPLIFGIVLAWLLATGVSHCHANVDITELRSEVSMATCNTPPPLPWGIKYEYILTEAVSLCTPYVPAFEWQLTEYCSFHYTPKTVPLFPPLTPPLQPVGLHGLIKLFPDVCCWWIHSYPDICSVKFKLYKLAWKVG